MDEIIAAAWDVLVPVLSVVVTCKLCVDLCVRGRDLQALRGSVACRAWYPWRGKHRSPGPPEHGGSLSSPSGGAQLAEHTGTPQRER